MHIITIPDWHPYTINKLLGAHFGKRMRMKKSDVEMIWAYSHHVPKAQGKRSVEITIYCEGRGRRPDGDAHFKTVLDALVKNKLLVDDGGAWCDILPTKILDGKKSTVILLHEAN